MKQTNRLKYKEAAQGYLYIMPSLILLLFFSVIPILGSFFLSFTDYNVLTAPSWAGLKNYHRLFSDPNIKAALRNTLVYAVITVPLQTCISLVFAAVIAEKFRDPFGNFVKGSLFIPVVASVSIIGTIWKAFLSGGGLVNNILLDLGMDTMNILGNKQTALIVVSLVGVWKNIGYFLVIYYAGIMDIPRALYEAAEIDGASPVQRFFHITLPNLKSVSYLVITVGIIWGFQEFGIVRVMTDGGPGNATLTMVVNIYRAAFKEYRMGYACAMSVLLLFCILIVSVIQKIVMRDKED